MKRKVIRLHDMKIFDSIRQAEKELNVYNITYNCQGKYDYIRQKGGIKIYEKWMFYDEFCRKIELEK